MNEKSRLAMRNYFAAIAKTCGVAELTDLASFSLSDVVTVKFQDIVQASDSFLSKITMMPVLSNEGQVFTLDFPGTLAGRVDTSKTTRKGQTVGAKDLRTYSCKETQFDAFLAYKYIDSMAVFSNFKQLISKAVNTRIALDMLLIGFNGATYSATPDRTQNKLLQDVNTGWLHDLKTNCPTNFIATATLGTNGNMTNLDHAVAELLALIPTEHRAGLCVLAGSDLIAEYNTETYKKFGSQPSEKEVFARMSQNFAGLNVESPAGFPQRALMIVNPKNLIRYYHVTSMRKCILEKPDENGFKHLTEVNECYRIGTLEACAAIENLTIAQETA